MSAKTISIVIITAIIIIFLMLNTDAVEFNFIFVKAEVSKLLIVGVCTFIGFAIGYWAAKPKTTVTTYDKEGTQDNPEDRRNELSDEDRDYIS
ncbi:LapA family protein [Pedobacter sp. JCM 36344]|uniref:LapA family protein n=1 Tax=Pedobacter sp. JCM 36344 TaxID=3374280 RepID=UPI003978B229